MTLIQSLTNKCHTITMDCDEQTITLKVRAPMVPHVTALLEDHDAMDDDFERRGLFYFMTLRLGMVV